jgi:hypothetical protein
VLTCTGRGFPPDFTFAELVSFGDRLRAGWSPQRHQIHASLPAGFPAGRAFFVLPPFTDRRRIIWPQHYSMQGPLRAMVANRVLLLERKHRVADHVPIDTDVHPVRPNSQRRCCKVVDVLATSDSEVRVAIRRCDVDALGNRTNCSARSTSYRDGRRRQRAGRNVGCRCHHQSCLNSFSFCLARHIRKWCV